MKKSIKHDLKIAAVDAETNSEDVPEFKKYEMTCWL